MNELTTTWYQQLIEDLRKLEFTGIVLTKHAIGKRILEDFEENGEPKQGRGGDRRVENIAKDINVGLADLYACIKFARMFPDKVSDAVRDFSWRYITHELLPDKPTKYQIIYADPPWGYYEGGYKNQSQHYDTMSIGAISNYLEDENIVTDDNCLLFLWVTFPILFEAKQVIDAWGFHYSTCAFTWVKANKGGEGFFFGLGNWTRANTELCLLARKGKIERKNATISQIIYEPVMEHSEKPAIVRDKIIQLVGIDTQPRAELFARK